jgi:hypothetical protein
MMGLRDDAVDILMMPEKTGFDFLATIFFFAGFFLAAAFLAGAFFIDFFLDFDAMEDSSQFLRPPGAFGWRFDAAGWGIPYTIQKAKVNATLVRRQPLPAGNTL